MKNIQPVKRSKQLVSLSREHHDALLFTWKIKEGLKNKTALSVIAEYINWFWENHLKDHFNNEERILLPYFPETDHLAQQLRKEHESIRSIVTNDLDEASVISLANLVNDHIRFEERKLFPHIEQSLSADQLDKISKLLNTHPECKTDWTKEFWKKSK